jgi:hypothetical protein
MAAPREQWIVTRRRKRRQTPMRRRRIGAAAHAGAGGGAVAALGDFPAPVMPEPEGGRAKAVSGAVSVLLHGAALGGILLAAWLTPPEVVEEIIEITRLEDLQEPAREEPAPAPRVIRESAGRYDPAPMALAPQVVNPAVVQRAAPAVAARRLEVESVSPVQAPREVRRASRVVEQARAYQSVASATASPVAVDAQAPAIRGPIEVQAPAGVQSGPRQVVSRGNTVGLAGPQALGTGSSVREGVASGRDVLGSDTGVRAQVNWSVGSGGRGSGGSGTGPGGVPAEDCLRRAEVASYMQHIKSRVLSRWVLPTGVEGNREVTLRFSLDPAGTANRVEFVNTGNAVLGESAAKAMRSASPFDPMSDRVRCLAGTPLVATFRNPTVAAN